MDITNKSKQDSKFCFGVSLFPRQRSFLFFSKLAIHFWLVLSPRFFTVWMFNLCGDFSLSSAVVTAKVFQWNSSFLILGPLGCVRALGYVHILHFFILMLYRELLLLQGASCGGKKKKKSTWSVSILIKPHSHCCKQQKQYQLTTTTVISFFKLSLKNP